MSTLAPDRQSIKPDVLEAHALRSVHRSIKPLFLRGLDFFFARQYCCPLYPSMTALGVTDHTQLAFIDERIQVCAGNMEKPRSLFTCEFFASLLGATGGGTGGL